MLDIDLSAKQMRPELINKIKNLDRKHLLGLYQFVAQLYAKDLINAVADSEIAGEVNEKSVEKLIKQYRNRHPYK